MVGVYRSLILLGLSLASLFLNSCKPPGLKVERDRDGEEHLILLKNTRAIVGLIPEKGGRVVVYRRPWDRNLIDSPASSWTDRTIRGHFQTTLNPRMDQGETRIVASSAVHLELETRTASATLWCRTRFQLLPEGDLLQRSEWHHSGSESLPFQWVSRTPFFFRASVYGRAENDSSWEKTYPGEFRPGVERMPHEKIDGFLTFPRQLDFPPGITSRVGSFTNQDSHAFIAAFYRSHCFLKILELETGERPVRTRIYHRRVPPHSEQENLLEFSFVSERMDLQAGQSITFRERWKLIEYAEPNTREIEAFFLNNLLPRLGIIPD